MLSGLGWKKLKNLRNKNPPAAGGGQKTNTP
jgi:hypothetical protein